MLSFGPRILLLGLLVSVTVGNSFIFFADTENRAVFSELVTIIAASTAVILATAIAFRQNIGASHGKTYLSLTIGLVLWLCADIIWAAYELYFHVAAPIPSLSDILWLSGYPFFAYNLFLTYKEFQKRIKNYKKILVATLIVNAVFLGYLIPLTINLSDFSSQGGLAMFIVIIAYPILNAILIVPAISILLGLWKDKPWSIPWTFKALSLFCIVMTDSWFAFIIITGLQEQVWISSMLFGAEYLIMAGGLIWYNKFLQIYNNHPSNEIHQASSVTPEAMLSDARRKQIGEKADTANAKRYPHMDIIVAIILIAAVISYGIFQSNTTTATQILQPDDGNATIKIGALLPLSGTLASFGESADASLRLAQKDINDHFLKSGSHNRLELIIEDTKTDPEKAVEKLNDLHSKGVQMVIGPATSANVAAVKNYADQNGILILSASSTATQLAEPNDNIFRLVPDDSHQAQAIAMKMWKDGIRVVVPIWRTDIFGEGLHSALKENFERLGGKVAEGVGYKPPTGDFAASLHRINFIFWEQDLKMLDSRVNDAVKQYGADRVGVYIVSFDEIVPIMIQAERHPGLSSVKWYGSDGSVQNADLIRNVDAANFAAKTSFINPIYGAEENKRFDDVNQHITAEIGHSHRSYAEVAYDALWIAAMTYNQTGNNQVDADTLRRVFVETANSYDGITGKTLLNYAGDRSIGSYDLWTITRHYNNNNTEGESTYQWMRVGTIANVD
jgi:branched-chain amino acid transport system substrate-binding protein